MKVFKLGLPLVALCFSGVMASANEDLAPTTDYGYEDIENGDTSPFETYADDDAAAYDHYAGRGRGDRSTRFMVRCESNDYRYVKCDVPRRGRVVAAEVARNISLLRCVEGRNWGLTNDGVWVSAGCRADFSVWVEDGRDDRGPGRGDGRGPGRGDDRGPGRGDDRGPGRGDDRGPGRGPGRR